MQSHSRIKAIVWDYDGTLIDTRIKNLNVTRKIVEKASGKSYQSFPALINLPDFERAHQQSQNWRDFYYRQFGFNEEETSHFGSWWTEFQINDNTPLELFPGIDSIIKTFENYPQAIVSQNSSKIINHTLKELRITNHFSCIIGYEEVQMLQQKPHPEGLLKCLKKLGDLKDGIILYIGDHETDACLVKNINQHFNQNGSNLKALSIGAFYIYPTDTGNWQTKPDFEAHQTEDLFKIIKTI